MGGSPMAGFRRDPSVADQPLQRATVRRVWAFSRPYRRRLGGYLALVVAGSLLALIPPLLFKALIDRAIPGADRGLVTVLALVALGVAVLELLLDLVSRWLSSSIGEGVIYDLRTALFDHVQRMPLGFFTSTQTGALVSRLNGDVIGAQRAITGTLGQVLFNVSTLVSTVIAMAILEWRLTLLALVVLPLFVLPARRVGRKLQVLTREGMGLNAAMSATMTERFGVAGAMLVKLFGRHDDEVADFSARAARVRDIGIRSAMYGRAFFSTLTLVAAVGTAIVYWWGGQLVISGAIPLGTLVALAAYVTRIYSPLTSLTNARIDVMTAFVSFERVFEVLDAPSGITDAPDAVELRRPRGRVELDDVWFRYPAPREVSVASLEGDSPVPNPPEGARPATVLHGVSAVAEPGTMTALVGPSGAGKSTISALIPRLYDVSAGAVRIDGVDVRAATQASLRAAIGVVTQDAHLFHDTVAANLRYARPGATDAEVEAACRAAQIHDVVAALPEGYDTVVGERGYRLSGGEKQRLAIARMLLKDPAIVVLDEATSHLDAESEVLVQRALDAALAGRTSIVIAHRLSTIQAADQILVVDGGRIVQRGTHDELLARGGLYADLHRAFVRAAPEADGTAGVDGLVVPGPA
jgi:ATP-binding cassette subfamily B protein